MNQERLLVLSRDGFFRGFLLLFSAVFIGYLWNARPDMSPNDNARWDTIWSLLEYRTYQIYDTKEEAEKYGLPQQFGTIDKVQKDGRTFASKPPLYPTVIAGVLFVPRCILGEPFSKDRVDDKGQLIRGSIHIYGKITLIVFNVLPFLGMLILYRRFLDRYTRGDFVWLFALLAGAIGTFTTGYLVTLNNHTQAAAFAFFTAYLMLTIWYEKKVEPWRFALAGLCAGWTAANEFPAGLLVLAAMAIALGVDRRKTLIYFLPPVVLVAGALFLTNYLAIGSLKPAYLQKALYDYPDSYWTNPEKKSGIDALNDHPEPLWLYLLHMTIGHHGLFSLTPIWLIAAWGAWVNARGRDEKLRGLVWPILAVSLGVFVAYWIFNSERNYGGFCHGMRWLVWLGPLWLLLLPAGLEELAWNVVGRRLAWLALAISAFTMADTMYNPWTRAWLHRVLLWFGAIDY
jgi:hypothetical protein